MAFPSANDLKRSMLGGIMSEEEIQAYDRKFEAAEARKADEKAQRAGFKSAAEMDNAIRTGQYTKPASMVVNQVGQIVQSRFAASAIGEMEDRRAVTREQQSAAADNRERISDRYKDVADDVHESRNFGDLSR